MTKTTEALQVVGGAVVALFFIDALGFAAWVLSGQVPMDNFYIGTITAHILRAILS